MMSDLFIDLNKTFALHPVSDDILLNRNEAAVKESITNLIFTGPYERYRQPRLGAGIPQDLFENISPQTEYNVRERIKAVIANYEPRANLERVHVSVLPDQNAYSVTIVFTLVNSFTPVTIEKILTRRR